MCRTTRSLHALGQAIGAHAPPFGNSSHLQIPRAIYRKLSFELTQSLLEDFDCGLTRQHSGWT